MSLFEEIQIEKFCELRGTLTETILSEAPFCGERATTIRDTGVGSKLLAAEAQNTITNDVDGDDMVSSLGRPKAAHYGAGVGVAVSSEDYGIASILLPFQVTPPSRSSHRSEQMPLRSVLTASHCASLF